MYMSDTLSLVYIVNVRRTRVIVKTVSQICRSLSSKDAAKVECFADTGNPLGALHLPHGITLDESVDMLCVADREGRRVVCYRAGLYTPSSFGSVVSVVSESEDRRIFDVTALG